MRERGERIDQRPVHVGDLARLPWREEASPVLLRSNADGATADSGAASGLGTSLPGIRASIAGGNRSGKRASISGDGYRIGLIVGVQQIAGSASSPPTSTIPRTTRPSRPTRTPMAPGREPRRSPAGPTTA